MASWWQFFLYCEMGAMKQMRCNSVADKGRERDETECAVVDAVLCVKLLKNDRNKQADMGKKGEFCFQVCFKISKHSFETKR